MERYYKYTKICLVFSLVFFLQANSYGQAFMASASNPGKVDKISLGEGLAKTENQLLLDLVTKAGLMPILSGTDEYTFFAPSEDALKPYTGASPDQLRNLLSQHIVKGKLKASDLKDGSDIKTIQGNTLKVFRKKDSIIVNGMRIDKPDQVYANGVWHQLNGCLKNNKADL